MCLFAAGTCKACLSLFLVVYCGMDVVAVAASTVFATLMSSSLLLYLMKNTKSAIHISFHDMKVDWGILRQILSIVRRPACRALSSACRMSSSRRPSTASAQRSWQLRRLLSIWKSLCTTS